MNLVVYSDNPLNEDHIDKISKLNKSYVVTKNLENARDLQRSGYVVVIIPDNKTRVTYEENIARVYSRRYTDKVASAYCITSFDREVIVLS